MTTSEKVEIKAGQTWASKGKPFRDIEILRTPLPGSDYVRVDYGWKTMTITVDHLRRAYRLFDPYADAAQASK